MSQYFEENKKLKNNIKENICNINGITFKFYTDNGLFNKKGLDYGTKCLLTHFDYKNKKSFLDIGCGCGPVGIYLSLLDNNNKVDMVDVNNAAVEISKKSLKLNNICNANVFVSNTYENINKRYDAILTNPPIHAGKKVVYDIIGNAINFLSDKGELWIVMRKDQGCKSMIKDFSDIYDFEIVKKDNGFYIIVGKNKSSN